MTSTNIKFTYLIAIVMILFITNGCKREEPTSWGTNVLLPIAHGNISFNDLINDTLTEYDSDGVLHFIYESNAFNLDLDTLVRIPDTLVSNGFDVPLPGGPFFLDPGTQILNTESSLDFEFNDVLVRKVRVKEGLMKYQLRSYVNGYLDVTYDLPGVVGSQGSLLLEETTEPSLSDLEPFIKEGEFNIAGFEFFMTGELGNEFNSLFGEINVSVSDSFTQQAEVYGDDSVAVDIEIIGVVVEYAKGYFGQYSESLIDTIDFTPLNGLEEGSINLDEISIGLELKNYVGVDAQWVINDLRAIQEATNSSLSLDHEIIGTPVNITRAFDTGSEVIPSVLDYSFTDQNSNVSQFIGLLPNQLGINFDLEINPLGDVSGANDFIYTDLPLEANVLVDIPMCVSVNNVLFVDTLDVSAEIENVNKASIFAYIDNNFPFAASAEILIVDGDGSVLEEMTTDLFIQAAAYDVILDDYLTASSTLQVDLSEELLNGSYEEYYIVLRLRANTNGEIKMRDDMSLDIKIVAEIDGVIQYD